MPKRSFPGVIIIVGILMIVSSLVYWRFSVTNDRPGLTGLPKSLVGLPLTTATYGTDAVNEITRMHGKEFPLNSGSMGTYGKNSEATLWVAGFPTETLAAEMVSAMGEKIAAENTPFTPTGEQEMRGRTIYELDGMSQKHFYYQSGVFVIWLAADPQLAELAILQTLDAYP